MPKANFPLWERVIEDMHKRDHFGREKYKVKLTADTYVDFLQEAYEEALDMVVYLKGAIEREKELKGGNDA